MGRRRTQCRPSHARAWRPVGGIQIHLTNRNFGSPVQLISGSASSKAGEHFQKEVRDRICGALPCQKVARPRAASGHGGPRSQALGIGTNPQLPLAGSWWSISGSPGGLWLWSWPGVTGWGGAWSCGHGPVRQGSHKAAHHLSCVGSSENLSKYVMLPTESTHQVWGQSLCDSCPHTCLESAGGTHGCPSRNRGGASPAELCSRLPSELRWGSRTTRFQTLPILLFHRHAPSPHTTFSACPHLRNGPSVHLHVELS